MCQGELTLSISKVKLRSKVSGIQKVPILIHRKGLVLLQMMPNYSTKIQLLHIKLFCQLRCTKSILWIKCQRKRTAMETGSYDLITLKL